jgi:lipopolysaccharide/colanic/teichoic acid biosynthesis glycosyltransferase
VWIGSYECFQLRWVDADAKNCPGFFELVFLTVAACSVRSFLDIESLMKRFLDLAGAGSALLVLSPLIFMTAILVRLKMGSPVLFRQARPGRGEKIFGLVKFRTMTAARDADGCLLPDEKRLTPFGAFLRKTSLDELPQLWNVFKGDMSLVGPRPLLPEYLPRYSECQRRRHGVRPGITGWAQINGRNALTWEEKLALDSWYVDNRGVWLDLQILVNTVFRVLRRDGISQTGHTTMPEFMGTEALAPLRPGEVTGSITLTPLDHSGRPHV